MLTRVFAFLFSVSYIVLMSTPVIAKSVPANLSLPGLEGGKLDAKTMAHKVVILQFWASWCQSCSQVMTITDGLTKGKPGAQLALVSVDEDMKSAKNYFSHLSPDLKALSAKAYFDMVGKSLAEGLGVSSLPAIVVVGKAGEVLLSITGHPNKDQVEAMRKLIDDKPTVAKTH